MEVVVVGLCCVLAAAALYLAVGVVMTARRRPPCARKPVRAKELLVSWIELLGHWAPMVRIGNKGFLRALTPRLARALASHGIALTNRGCVSLMVVFMMACMLLCLVVSGSLLGVLVGMVAGATGVAGLIGGHEKAVTSATADQMPEVLRSLSTALGAGKSLPQAIEHVGRNVGEPMGSEFLRASFEIKAGRSAEDAVREMCARVEAPGIALVGTALQISQRTGSALGELFSRTAQMVADTVDLRRELQVKTSQVRLSAKVVAGVPVLLFCVLTLFSPDYRQGVALPEGRACLCVAALLDVVALGMVRRVMLDGVR